MGSNEARISVRVPDLTGKTDASGAEAFACLQAGLIAKSSASYLIPERHYFDGKTVQHSANFGASLIFEALKGAEQLVENFDEEGTIREMYVVVKRLSLPSQGGIDYAA